MSDETTSVEDRIAASREARLRREDDEQYLTERGKLAGRDHLPPYEGELSDLQIRDLLLATPIPTRPDAFIGGMIEAERAAYLEDGAATFVDTHGTESQRAFAGKAREWIADAVAPEGPPAPKRTFTVSPRSGA